LFDEKPKELSFAKGHFIFEQKILQIWEWNLDG
jgi:hypothetical protein